jgi:hypothetical protein
VSQYDKSLRRTLSKSSDGSGEEPFCEVSEWSNEDGVDLQVSAGSDKQIISIDWLSAVALAEMILELSRADESAS